MAKINKSLTSTQFLAALAENGTWVGGIPFIFDAKSEKGKIFLARLVEVGLSASAEEISEAVAKFFEEGNKKWNVSVIRFKKLNDGRLEVGLSPDRFAIDLARQMSHRVPF